MNVSRGHWFMRLMYHVGRWEFARDRRRLSHSLLDPERTRTMLVEFIHRP